MPVRQFLDGADEPYCIKSQIKKTNNDLVPTRAQHSKMQDDQQVTASLDDVIRILENLRKHAPNGLIVEAGCPPQSRRLPSENSVAERLEPKAAASAATDYKHRRLREKIFGADLFGEPMWDMLLDLYVQSHEGRRTTVSNLVAASVSASTTGLRCVSLMCDAGLVRREKSSSDKRVTYIELTESARLLIFKYYAARDGYWVDRLAVPVALKTR